MDSTDYMRIIIRVHQHLCCSAESWRGLSESRPMTKSHFWLEFLRVQVCLSDLHHLECPLLWSPLERQRSLKKLAKNMGKFIAVLVSGERKTAGRTTIIFVKKKPSRAASQEGKSKEYECDFIAILKVSIQKTSMPNDFSPWISKLSQGSRYLKEVAKNRTTGPDNNNVKNVDGNPKFCSPAHTFGDCHI